MNIKTAELIAEAHDGLEVYENYSGRGMYGETTSGVVGSTDDFHWALAEIMESYSQHSREKVAEALRCLQRDNMGLDMIFY